MAKLTMTNRMRRGISCGIGVVAVVSILYVLFGISLARGLQWQLIHYIERRYLPDYRTKYGFWPKDLSGLEGDLKYRIEHPDPEGYPGRMISSSASSLLELYYQLRPTITETRSTSQTYNGLVKFNWIFGDTSGVSATIPDAKTDSVRPLRVHEK